MPPCEFSILDCELRIATGDAPIIAEVTERSSSQKRDCLPDGDIRVVRRFGKAEADGDLMNRHPAAMRFFERAKLRSCAEKAALFSLH
jgi:hypothetical protein